MIPIREVIVPSAAIGIPKRFARSSYEGIVNKTVTYHHVHK
jgi:hypothetical protein